MRQIKLKNLEIHNSLTDARKHLPDFEQPMLDYRSGIIQIVETIENGMTADQLNKALRIINAVKSAVNILNLEDADHSYLIERLNAHKFPFACSAFGELVNDIKNAPTVKLDSPEESL